VYVLSDKGAANSLTAWGHRPRTYGNTKAPALKARFTFSSCNRRLARAFSAWLYAISIPGAMPQVRRGESVLWRTYMRQRLWR
jgi:hypothetical protein